MGNRRGRRGAGPQRRHRECPAHGVDSDVAADCHRPVAVTLENLRRRVSPPPAPSGGGSPQQWQQVETFLGLTLPEDYKGLVDAFGSGQFDDFITLFTPFARDPYANL